MSIRVAKLLTQSLLASDTIWDTVVVSCCVEIFSRDINIIFKALLLPWRLFNRVYHETFEIKHGEMQGNVWYVSMATSIYLFPYL
jgi:hypothetical protein